MLDSYANLQTSIADWLNRSDLTAVIPDFITLAEAEMARRLRWVTRRVQVDDVAASPYTLPCTIAELRSIVPVSGSPTQDSAIQIGTPEVLADRRAGSGGVAGRPRWAAITSTGRELLLVPAPDQTYTFELIFFQKLQPLSATNTVNDELREAPDVYKAGCMHYAEDYLEHDEAALKWRTRFDLAIMQLNIQRENAEFGSGLRPMRLPQALG